MFWLYWITRRDNGLVARLLMLISLDVVSCHAEPTTSFVDQLVSAPSRRIQVALPGDVSSATQDQGKVDLKCWNP